MLGVGIDTIWDPRVLRNLKGDLCGRGLIFIGFDLIWGVPAHVGDDLAVWDVNMGVGIRNLFMKIVFEGRLLSWGSRMC